MNELALKILEKLLIRDKFGKVTNYNINALQADYSKLIKEFPQADPNLLNETLINMHRDDLIDIIAPNDLDTAIISLTLAGKNYYIAKTKVFK